MITLFIDSSSKSLSLAIVSSNKLIFNLKTESYSNHSNYLMNTIIKAFNDLNMNIKDIDDIVVLNGPGSFTGTRIGVTIAKTLAWSLNKKLYLVNNLKALSLNNKLNNDVTIAIIPDRSDNFYIGIYENNILEKYMNIEELPKYNKKNIEIISSFNIEIVDKICNNYSKENNVNKTIINEFNYINIIEYAHKNGYINTHLAEPLYLKRIDAEKIDK